MGPEALAQVLRPLQGMFQPERFPAVLVGLQVSDDAAVYKISDDVAVIQTLDFFTPVVDDPYDYGAIAAANAMSDVYAMGGEVVLALNICGFPPKLPEEIIAEILRGGAEKVLEAGGALAGGHTVDDNEPKYGLAVMGLVHPERILTKGGAQPGRPAGAHQAAGRGHHHHGRQRGRGRPGAPARGDRQHEAAQPRGGAAGPTGRRPRLHRHHRLRAARPRLRDGRAQRRPAALPLRPASLPGRRNPLRGRVALPGRDVPQRGVFRPPRDLCPVIPDEMRQLLFTPETSGGLLLAVAPDRADALAAAFAAAGEPLWIVGEVLPGEGIEVVST